jgi:hypothetical protein
MTDERIFLQHGGVLVTNARFVVEKKTYAMSSVSSVKVHKTNVGASNTSPAFFTIGAAIWLLTHLITSTAEIAGYALPVLLLIGSIYWYRSIKPKLEFRIVLTTTAGEQPALVSNDENEVITVEKALIEAIIHRG